MNIYQMRTILADTYTGASWKDRVSCMSDDQVLAIYKRLEREGELYKHNRRTSHDPTLPDIKIINYAYLTKDSEGRWIYCSPGP